MNLKKLLMFKLIENYLSKIRIILSQTVNFIRVPILDQVFNSLISFFGNIYILAKLPSHDFAAAGFTISISYFVSAIVKNKYLNTLNYVDANLKYTAFEQKVRLWRCNSLLLRLVPLVGEIQFAAC